MKTLILILMIVFTMPGHALKTNHCHYLEPWEQWDVLIKKYLHNMDVQMLHVFRIGLCKKIEKRYKLSANELTAMETPSPDADLDPEYKHVASNPKNAQLLQKRMERIKKRTAQ